MKIKALQEKSSEELTRLLTDFTAKVRELNFKDANKQLKNIRELRQLKKNIAQVKTLLNERSTDVSAGASVAKAEKTK